MFVTLIISCHNFIHRFLFWVNFGNNALIGRANMDGTSRINIATTDLGWPNGLAFDFACKYFNNKNIFNVILLHVSISNYFQPKIIMSRD